MPAVFNSSPSQHASFEAFNSVYPRLARNVIDAAVVVIDGSVSVPFLSRIESGVLRRGTPNWDVGVSLPEWAIGLSSTRRRRPSVSYHLLVRLRSLQSLHGAALLIFPLVVFPICDLFLLGSFLLDSFAACAGYRRRRGLSSAFAMPKDASNEPEFPFPGEYGPNGFATQYIRLDKLTNAQLSEYCKTFKLAHTGNKTMLTDRLKNFSKDRSRWDSLILGATNTHKGARKPQDEKKTKPKTSTIRREDLFQGADGVRTANAPTTERSKDLRTAEEKAAILPWAHRIVAKYPYQQIPGNDTMNPSIYVDSSTPTISTPSIASVSHICQYAQLVEANNTKLQAALPNTETAKLLSDFLAFVRHRDGDLAIQGANTAAHITIPAPTASAPSSTSVIPVILRPTASAPSLASVIPLSPCLAQDGAGPHTNVDIHMTVPSSNLGSNENSPTRTLQLANGRVLVFRESDIPDPPAVSYANNCEDLLGVWTDKSLDWNGKSPLKVKGVPVPLVYWPLVYKYWKGNQWKGAKKSWFQWKYRL
ncbi:hypothetical protein C8R45DRAFT_1132702 [Mycena sanguinolenta]|nr:hypothetical protein C8R45DRAFT_1132702 [Mycena sanguinolenta]